MEPHSSIESESKDIPLSNVSNIRSTLERLSLSDCFSTLPDDVLFNVLLYTGPKDIEKSVKLVNRSLHKATSLSLQLWREFCILTGKCLENRFANAKPDNECDEAWSPTFSGRVDAEDDAIGKETNPYRYYYHRNPCVPIDFETIASALAHCPRTPTVLALQDETEFNFAATGTICLMPGVHKERIIIKGEVWGVGSNANIKKAISIRASFPEKGATTIMHYADSQDAKNEPCISVSTRDYESLEGVQKGISVKLSHLRIVHCTCGSEIWSGNTAVVLDGARAQVIIDSCVIQSHSGRGIVVTNQAELQMTASSCLDCAATGIYIGDWGSRAHLSGCNVVRNGFGSRKLLSSDEGRQELDNVLTQWTRLRANANAGVTVAIEQFDVVPPGHSGVYIEGAMCWIDDTLIASNCLTGTSVVRNGFLSLSGCDITENGANGHPIAIEDEHDVGNNRLQGARIRGGVVEGPRQNNYSNSKRYQEKLRDGAAFSYGLMAPMAEEELLNLLHAV
jgi:hypothetical protein